jgi:galactokinase
MTGAGFGGCAVAIVKTELEIKFYNSVKDCYRKKSSLNPKIISCNPANGVTRLAPLA